MAKLSTEEIIDALKEMTLLEASELVHAIEDTFGVSAAAPVAVITAPATMFSVPDFWYTAVAPVICPPLIVTLPEGW